MTNIKFILTPLIILLVLVSPAHLLFAGNHEEEREKREKDNKRERNELINEVMNFLSTTTALFDAPVTPRGSTTSPPASAATPAEPVATSTPVISTSTPPAPATPTATTTATTTSPDPPVVAAPAPPRLPPLLAGTFGTGNTSLGQGFFGTNYYGGNGFNETTTRLLKILGFFSAALGLVFIASRAFTARSS